MTEEDKKLIEAAEILKNHCKGKNRCDECVFSYKIPRQDMIYCRITCDCVPSHWRIPNYLRWTDADVALAKALMAFGVEKVKNFKDECAIIYESKDGTYPVKNALPKGAFSTLNSYETVMLKDIVAEGENYG